MPNDKPVEIPRAGTRVVIDLMGRRYALDVSIKPIPDVEKAEVIEITRPPQAQGPKPRDRNRGDSSILPPS